MALLADGACTKFRSWDVDASQVSLYRVEWTGAGDPDAAAIRAALSAEPLQSRVTLEDARIVPNSYVLVRKIAGADAAGAAGGGFDIAAALLRLEAKINMVAYKASHVLSKLSVEKLEGGALFYIKSSRRGTPVFCGFFVSKRVALTTNHDPLFQGEKPASIFGYSSSLPARPLEFELFHTDAALDFSVLRLKHGVLSAFFSLPSFSGIESGIDLGLVTMSVGSSLEIGAPPHVSQHRVTVSSLDDTFILYDGASMWKGDPGGALLFDEDCVVGLHLEVIDDKPVLAPYGSSGSKRARDKAGACISDDAVAAAVVQVSDDIANLGHALERVSVAASSDAKVCRALLVTHSAVLAAVERARVE